jgi:hypothetical protein
MAAAAGSLFGVIEKTESLLLIGGALVFVYWFMTSDSTQAIRDAAKAVAPIPNSLVVQPPGTSTQVGASTFGTTSAGESYSVQGSGAITIMGVNGVPKTYGASYLIPSLGQSVSDLRALGYSDTDIVGMLSADDAVVPTGV